jgi:tryptophan-rich sensory protein
MSLNPPPIVFRIVWPILYSLLVVVTILFYVYPSTNSTIMRATEVFFWVGIALNLIWPTIFFRLQMKNLATVLSIVLLLLACITLVLFAMGDSSVRWVNFALYSLYTGWLFFAVVLLFGSPPQYLESVMK